MGLLPGALLGSGFLYLIGPGSLSGRGRLEDFLLCFFATAPPCRIVWTPIYNPSFAGRESGVRATREQHNPADLFAVVHLLRRFRMNLLPFIVAYHAGSK